MYKSDSYSFFTPPTVIFSLSSRPIAIKVSLAGNRYAIVGEHQVCASTILPTKDFYYPGRKYEGIQIYVDLAVIREAKGRDFLSELGIHADGIVELFCGSDGLYLHRMSEAVFALAGEMREEPETGLLRYFTVRILHELMEMPCESESDTYFTRSQRI